MASDYLSVIYTQRECIARGVSRISAWHHRDEKVTRNMWKLQAVGIQI